MRRHGRRLQQLRRVVVTCAVLLLAVIAFAPGATAGTTAPATTAPATTIPVSATTEAVAAAQAAGLRVAVAVTDTTTGATTVAGEATALFPSESVVKVVIAARLAVEQQLTGAVEQQAIAMLTASDDRAANALWGLVGGPDVVAWATERYGLTGLDAPSEWGWWGNTKVSAAGLAALYTALLDDPVVAPWLVAQLSAMTATATDGMDQTFGFGAAVATGDAAAKQGWGGDDDAESTANLLSTGYLANGRWAVAVIVQNPDGGSNTALVPTIDAVAAAVTADTTSALEAQSAADTVATAEDTMADAVPGATTPGAAIVGGASGPMSTGPWWPSSVAVLGAAALLAALTAVVTVSRRRATARLW